MRLSRKRPAIAGVLVVGAGGLGRCVAQYLEDARRAGERARFAGFLDDDTGRPGVLGSPDERRGERRVVAVGAPAMRRAIAERLTRAKAPLHTLVHPLAYVAPTAVLGPGCVVGPFAYVGPGARLADHVFVNAHAFVDHDVELGRWCYVGPQAVICGGATIGDESLIRPQSVVPAGAEVHGAAAPAPGAGGRGARPRTRGSASGRSTGS